MNNKSSLTRLLNHKLFTSTLLFITLFQGTLPVKAQPQIIPFLPELRDTSSWLPQNSQEANITTCIRLDGLCLFNITYPKSKIAERVETINNRLDRITNLYFSQENPELEITQRGQENPRIYVTVGDETIQLLTIGNLDLQNEGIDAETKANNIIEQLREGLIEAKNERKLESLISRGLIAIGILGGAFIVNKLIIRKINRLKTSQESIGEERSDQPMSMLLTNRQHWNIKEVQYRLLQLAQAGIWIGSSLIIIGLFPYTRIAQIWLVSLLRIPARLGIVGVGTYLTIRLSYALIAKVTSVLMIRNLLDFQENQRLQLRINTVTVVFRSVVTIVLTGSGFLIGLSLIGVNTAPLLAGLGILGVGVSLASQNLIRDAINGFFIILEDQYAVGDVIQVQDFGGLVENINLRITQLRDPEGRLITIPNSEVKIVANHSSNWSRADLLIPVAYDADIDQVLHIVKDVAELMAKDRQWRHHIVDKPEILGVDNFEQRGLIIRVWIKTKPLKQWDVSREFRRRLKVEFDKQGLPLPVPQQKVWFTNDNMNNKDQNDHIVV
ncbi:mechanosensitive ion channel family protein [Crocosphaera subtropica]|uniref:mechanosensitive ion channel family protein n=1 Tax=Crocosphaera subtropica TaxID=2546360 RepID=UPI001FAF07BF|nr:mechanosensitive ion channel family protein [Crocosphaera subtropica]